MSEEEEKIEEQEETEEQEEQEESQEQELDDKDARIKELEEELEKERVKEKNFKSLKDQEKGKRKKISERVDDMEKMLEQERENRQKLQDSVMKDARGMAHSQLAGDDKDLQSKLDERVKASEVYLGVPKDSKELLERYERAYEFLEGNQKKVNPLHAYHPVTGTQNDLGRKSKRFTDSQEGKKLMEDKFPQIVALEKKNKK